MPRGPQLTFKIISAERAVILALGSPRGAHLGSRWPLCAHPYLYSLTSTKWLNFSWLIFSKFTHQAPRANHGTHEYRPPRDGQSCCLTARAAKTRGWPPDGRAVPPRRAPIRAAAAGGRPNPGTAP